MNFALNAFALILSNQDIDPRNVAEEQISAQPVAPLTGALANLAYAKPSRVRQPIDRFKICRLARTNNSAVYICCHDNKSDKQYQRKVFQKVPPLDEM